MKGRQRPFRKERKAKRRKTEAAAAGPQGPRRRRLGVLGCPVGNVGQPHGPCRGRDPEVPQLQREPPWDPGHLRFWQEGQTGTGRARASLGGLRGPRPGSECSPEQRAPRS